MKTGRCQTFSSALLGTKGVKRNKENSQNCYFKKGSVYFATKIAAAKGLVERK